MQPEARNGARRGDAIQPKVCRNGLSRIQRQHGISADASGGVVKQRTKILRFFSLCEKKIYAVDCGSLEQNFLISFLIFL